MSERDAGEPRPVGRPSEYTVELAAEICGHLAAGKSLVTICRAEDMPNPATVYRWLIAHDDFREMYTRAREDQADTLADETLDIADDGRNDWMAANDPDAPGYRLNGENIQRSRLRVETRKWIASKLKPRKYGEKITQELTGKDGGAIEIADARERNLALLKSVASRIAGAAPAGAAGADPEPDDAGGDA